MNYKLYNVDHLKHLCQKYGLRPSKNYGQNYLINDDVIDAMLDSAQLTKKDTVIEVGPGFGILTQELVEKVKQVYAFEIEKKLEPYWEEKISNEQIENLKIIWGNILYTAPEIFPKNYKVVANLPYQITSPLLKLFLQDLKNKPKELTLMVQKEVAERICASPGNLSVLGLSVQYYATAEIIGIIKRSNFWPEPQVDSAVIKIKLNKTSRTPAEEKKFFQIIKIGFAQKRKLLIKNLLPYIGKQNRGLLLEKLKELGIKDTVRAQELKISDWEELIKISTLS